MPKSYELISNSNANSSGKTDANLANDSLHLGGIPAEEYATEEYVQDYHDNKESNLKNYIDSQDNAKLNAAKEYANSLVRNQDFSDFAKNKDIQALDNKLSKKIEECHTNCENKIDEVVKDVNANFDTVTKSIEDINKNIGDINANIDEIEKNITDMNSSINGNISDLDKKYDELFQSVSDGKSKIAGAITDKGVATSATDTFSNMASNIRKIETGGSGGGGGSGGTGIDTSDATATESDILLGKTAYARGSKITGTNTGIPTWTTPTYGTDTSGATATANDILFGKTAYANGQLITGTLINNQVEEIYAPNEDNYNVTLISNFNDSVEIDGIKYSFGKICAISPDGNNIVRIASATINGKSKHFIASNRASDTTLYYTKVVGSLGDVEYRKWLWSFEELGLDESKSVIDIYVGNTGVDGSEQKAILCIVQTGSIHFYKYNMISGDGQIDCEYNSKDIWHWKIDFTDYHDTESSSIDFEQTLFISCSNLNPYAFGLINIDCDLSEGNKYTCYMFNLYQFINEKTGLGYVSSTKISGGTGRVGLNGFYTNRVKFSLNDNYMYGSIGSNVIIASIEKSEQNRYSFNLIYANLYANATLEIFPNESEALIGGSIYKINNNNNRISLSKIADSVCSTCGGNVSFSGFSIDGQYYYIFKDTDFYMYRIAENELLTWEELSDQEFHVEDHYSYSTVRYIFQMSMDLSFGTKLVDSSTGAKLYRWRKIIDDKNVIGLRYQGKIFYTSLQNQGLTATAADVANNKKFIGISGMPEKGEL